MDYVEFVKMKERFRTADTAGKIEIYVNASGLSQTQYKELLVMFPMRELSKLEEALS